MVRVGPLNSLNFAQAKAEHWSFFFFFHEVVFPLFCFLVLPKINCASHFSAQEVIPHVAQHATFSRSIWGFLSVLPPTLEWIKNNEEIKHISSTMYGLACYIRKEQTQAS